MSVEAAFKTNTGTRNFTAATTYTAGEIVQLDDGTVGIIKTALASGDVGAVYTEGVFEILCATGTTWSAGDPVWWDISASLAVTAQGAVGDLYLGCAEKAKTTEVLVRVDLGKGKIGAGNQANVGLYRSRIASIAHDDTAEHDLILATENYGGLMLAAFLGKVTEAPAGSSEDQLVITLYDSDDNALSTLTTTNTTPDAIGDVVVGAVGNFTAATGTVMGVIPAGKGAYAKVSQPTVGTPAGEVDVHVIVYPLL